jgi:hypothetical protein
MAETYLSGGQQTTVNSTITELFPALAFNTGFNPNSPSELLDYIRKLNLGGRSSKATFVTGTNEKAAAEFITLTSKIRPDMLKEKVNNAFAITKYLYSLNRTRPIEKVVWGYREKPKGVPAGHAGDIFIFFRDDSSPKIMGLSLKAGSKTSKEPKLNSYVKTTMLKPMWRKSAPNALEELKRDLWIKVYSKIPGLSKSVTKDNYYTITGKTLSLTPNPELIKALIAFNQSDPKGFDELYWVMNRTCREKICSMINNDFKATKEWIRSEFRLETSNDLECPLVLVKAIGTRVDVAGDPLADFIRKATRAHAYLAENSVQEWFIDLTGGRSKITLMMTIRSDSGFRPNKPKGKLGTFIGLKLLYRGIKKHIVED